MRKVVYLYGYLRKGCSFDLAWRNQVQSVFEIVGCEVLNPARGHLIIYDPDEIADVFTPHELFHRDRRDIFRSDIMFGVIQPNDGDRPPVGSLIELGMAHEMPGQKLVCLVSVDPNIIEHPFVKETTTAVFGDLDTAVRFVKENWL